MEGVRLNAYRRAGVRVHTGGLLVAHLFTDPSFSGCVRGAVVVVVVVVVCSCCVTLHFLCCFHPLRLGLVLQFSVLPLGREGRGG